MTVACRALLALVFLLLPAPTNEERELFGRPLPTLKGHPSVVLYANQVTQRAISVPMTELSFRLRDLHPIFLVRADLGGLPKLFTGFARSEMRSEYFKGIQRYQRFCREANLSAPSLGEAAASFFMSYDPVGAPHRALGLPQGFHVALAIAYGTDGNEIARGWFPAQMDTLEAAIRAAPGTSRSALQLRDAPFGTIR